MVNRKGLGLGLGKGYKNMLPQDSFTHRLSALGIKSVHHPIQTAIIVPSTDKDNKSISAKEFKDRVDNTRKDLSNLFGGYTSIRSVGGWVDDKGKLIKERGNVVESFAKEKDFNKNKDKFIKYARKKRKEWEQQQLSIIYENDLFLI